jgi:hypothetical protein
VLPVIWQNYNFSPAFMYKFYGHIYIIVEEEDKGGL